MANVLFLAAAAQSCRLRGRLGTGFTRTAVLTVASGLILATFGSAFLSAQWLRTPADKLPRTPDGSPNLSGPPPVAADGHPDLSGIWMPNSRSLQSLAVGTERGDVPYQPWAAELAKERANGARGKDDPAAHCVPGMPKLIVLPYPYKIFQLPGVTIILYEGFTTFRQIFTDGRELPRDPQPSWLGYSTGKWEGDTFVVDTIGINDQTWLDNAGRPHSDALHTIERYRRRDVGTLDVTLTIDDPKAYTRPWSVNNSPSRLVLGQDLLEYVCTENNRDLEHLVGDGRK
jgi:hypothetical protein